MVFCNIIPFLNLSHPFFYQQDEFTYVSRSWVLAGHIFHNYPVPSFYDLYWGDHPFYAWILFAIFGGIVPGNDWMFKARLFIFIINILTKIVLYFAADKYFGKKVAYVSLIIFSFQSGISHYYTYFYFDTIATFFIMISFYFFYSTPIGLINKTDQFSYEESAKNTIEFPEKLRFFFSAFLFGLGVGCKFPVIFFLPGFVIFYITRQNIPKNLFNKINFLKHLRYWIKWLCFVTIPLMIWGLMLIISSHGVYIYTSTFGQLFRPDNETDNFIKVFSIDWLYYFPIFIIAIFFSLGLLLIFYTGSIISYLKNKQLVNKKILSKSQTLNNEKKILFLKQNGYYYCFPLFYIFFLIREGVVLPHYIIPLLPSASIFLAVLIISQLEYYSWWIIDKVYQKEEEKQKRNKNDGNPTSNDDFELKISKKKFYISIFIFIIGSIQLGLLYIPPHYENLQYNNTNIQYEALDWVINNLPHDSNIITSAFFISELRNAGFRYVQNPWFLDKEFKIDVLSNNSILMDQKTPLDGDWRNIDYLITPSLSDIDNPLIAPVTEHVVLIKSFYYNETLPTYQIHIYQVVT
jgi:4-amino-4-deoxy-L-arabinose transferase-like glycosyltransferase